MTIMYTYIVHNIFTLNVVISTSATVELSFSLHSITCPLGDVTVTKMSVITVLIIAVAANIALVVAVTITWKYCEFNKQATVAVSL